MNTLPVLVPLARPRRWPAYVAGTAPVVGLAFTLWIVTGGTVTGGARGVVLMLALPQALGALFAASILLVGTAIEAASRRPLSIAESTAPRAIVALAGGALALGAAIVLTARASVDVVVLGAIGVALGALALTGRRVAWRPRVAVFGLLAATAAVLIPRELGVYHLQAIYAWSHTRTDSQWSSSCSWTGGGKVSVADLARTWTIDTRALGGNVGTLLAQRPADHADLTLTVRGDVSASALGCLAPLYQHARLHTTLDFQASAARGSASCSVDGTIEIELTRDAIGSASCLYMRRQLAEAVLRQLESRAAALLRQE